MVRDEHGQKMSKTKENVVDPVELTERYGADALRLGLLLMAGPGRDVKLSEQRWKDTVTFSQRYGMPHALRFLILRRWSRVTGR